MSTACPVLFIDRDGTLVEEPPDHQVDSLARSASCRACLPRWRAEAPRLPAGDGYQPGRPGHRLLPAAAFEQAHNFILEAFASQGIEFERIFICPHFRPTAASAASPRPASCATSCATAHVDLAAQRGDRRPRNRPRVRAQPGHTRPARALQRHRARRPGRRSWQH